MLARRLLVLAAVLLALGAVAASLAPRALRGPAATGPSGLFSRQRACASCPVIRRPVPLHHGHSTAWGSPPSVEITLPVPRHAMQRWSVPEGPPLASGSAAIGGRG